MNSRSQRSQPSRRCAYSWCWCFSAECRWSTPMVYSLLDFFYLNINPMQMALKFVSNLNSYTLLAVPFFILMVSRQRWRHH